MIFLWFRMIVRKVWGDLNFLCVIKKSNQAIPLATVMWDTSLETNLRLIGNFLDLFNREWEIRRNVFKLPFYIFQTMLLLLPPASQLPEMCTDFMEVKVI